MEKLKSSRFSWNWVIVCRNRPVFHKVELQFARYQSMKQMRKTWRFIFQVHWDILNRRIDDIELNVIDISKKSRIEGWRSQQDIFSDNPTFGVLDQNFTLVPQKYLHWMLYTKKKIIIIIFNEIASSISVISLCTCVELLILALFLGETQGLTSWISIVTWWILLFDKMYFIWRAIKLAVWYSDIKLKYRSQFVLLHQLHASYTLRFLHVTLRFLHATLLARYATLLARYATFLTRYASCTLFWCSNTHWGL
jgi:hypothetical protein